MIHADNINQDFQWFIKPAGTIHNANRQFYLSNSDTRKGTNADFYTCHIRGNMNNALAFC